MSSLYDYRVALRRIIKERGSGDDQSPVIRTSLRALQTDATFVLLAERANGAEYVVLDPALASRLLDFKGPACGS